jgi:hypothetical protein
MPSIELMHEPRIHNPLLFLCLALKGPLNLTHSSTSTLRLIALNGLEGIEKDSS